MKVLIITSKRLKGEIENLLKNFNVEVLGIGDIASLINYEDLVKELRKKNLKEFDIILLPGNSRIDVNRLEKEFNARFYLGTKHYKDLPLLMKYIDRIKLSKNIPADEILKEKIVRENLKIYERTKTEEYIKKHGKQFIGNIPFGDGFPVRIISEINDCNEKDIDEILKEANYYIQSGADIIDLGFNESCPDKVYKIIKEVKSRINVPISIDTMEIENIKEGIKAGCDIILSFNERLLNKFNNIPCYIVLIPDELNNTESRIKSLEKNIKIAREKGFKVIVDPIMNVENISESIICYKYFKEKYNLPMLMGAGNLTELIDADSIGINALLCKMCYEIGIDFILTTEASDKTKGCVKELKTASIMMFISKIKNVPPKDLGIDLLVLKEKRIKRDPVNIEGKIIKAEDSNIFEIDKSGYFKITIDNNYIYCTFYSLKDNSKVTIIGKKAKDICNKIFEMNLISNIQHAMYLGRELQKAEFSLKYNKSYVQE